MSQQQIINPDNGDRQEKMRQTYDMVDQIDAEQGFPWGSLLLAIGCGIYLLNPLAGLDFLPDVLPVVGNLDEAGAALLLFRSLGKIGWNVIR